MFECGDVTVDLGCLWSVLGCGRTWPGVAGWTGLHCDGRMIVNPLSFGLIGKYREDEQVQMDKHNSSRRMANYMSVQRARLNVVIAILHTCKCNPCWYQRQRQRCHSVKHISKRLHILQPFWDCSHTQKNVLHTDSSHSHGKMLRGRYDCWESFVEALQTAISVH